MLRIHSRDVLSNRTPLDDRFFNDCYRARLTGDAYKPYRDSSGTGRWPAMHRMKAHRIG